MCWHQWQGWSRPQKPCACAPHTPALTRAQPLYVVLQGVAGGTFPAGTLGSSDGELECSQKHLHGWSCNEPECHSSLQFAASFLQTWTLHTCSCFIASHVLCQHASNIHSNALTPSALLRACLQFPPTAPAAAPALAQMTVYVTCQPTRRCGAAPMAQKHPWSLVCASPVRVPPAAAAWQPLPAGPLAPHSALMTQHRSAKPLAAAAAGQAGCQLHARRCKMLCAPAREEGWARGLVACAWRWASAAARACRAARQVLQLLWTCAAWMVPVQGRLCQTLCLLAKMQLLCPRAAV